MLVPLFYGAEKSGQDDEVRNAYQNLNALEDMQGVLMIIMKRVPLRIRDVIT